MTQTSFPDAAELGPFERWLSVWVGLATVVGMLVEVPVMLSLVAMLNKWGHDSN